MQLERLAHNSIYYHLIHRTSLQVVGAIAQTQDSRVYQTGYLNIDPTHPITVYKNGLAIPASDFRLHLVSGVITFQNVLLATDVVTADFWYNPFPWTDEWPETEFASPLGVLVDGSATLEPVSLGGEADNRVGVYCHLFAANKGTLRDMTSAVKRALFYYTAPIIDFDLMTPENADGEWDPTFTYPGTPVGYIEFERLGSDPVVMLESPGQLRRVVSAVAMFPDTLS